MEKRNVYRASLEKPEGKRPLGKWHGFREHYNESYQSIM
jgi:hypothetical protein